MTLLHVERTRETSSKKLSMFLELTKNTGLLSLMGRRGNKFILHSPCAKCKPSVPFPGRFSQNQVKSRTTGHQDVRSQNCWTPGSNTTRDQCEKHPFNQELKQDTVYSSFNILRLISTPTNNSIHECSSPSYTMSWYLYITTHILP